MRRQVLIRELVLLAASLASSAALMGLLVAAGLVGTFGSNPDAGRDGATRNLAATHVAVQAAAQPALLHAR
jgi:hypothetical protein